MQVERTCITCNEEALMFCRMCSTHQCTEHLCLHLNVAWEQNSWTKRHERDYEIQRSEQDLPDEASTWDEEANTNLSPESIGAPAIQSTPKALLSYTEAQLQAAYEFYTAQARRIRIELERRSLPAGGLLPSGRARNIPHARRELPKCKRAATLGKGAAYSRDVLLSKIRAGDLKVEDIIAKLTHMQAANTAGN